MRVSASPLWSLWRRSLEEGLVLFLIRANGDPAMAQIHIECTLGDVELLRDLAHTQRPLAIQGLGRQCRSFGLLREPWRTSTEAATRPAWVRSRIRSRSNSASAPNM